jgi:hypothetical protein
MPDANLRILVMVEGTSQAESSLKGVSGATEQVGTSSEQSSKKTGAFTSQLKALATGFAVYKGFQFMKSAVSTTTDLAKATAGLQRVTGMDTQTSAGWAATAQERGISAKTLTVSMATLGRQMQGVSKGTKSSIEAFGQLGISQQQLKRMDTQQTLSAIANGLQKMPPGAQKAAAAQKLLGRSGTALLPILNNGSKALNDEINNMGKATGITNGNIKSTLAYVKQQREMSAAMLGVKIAIGTALIPILKGLTQALMPVMQTFAKLMQQSPLFRTAIYALAAALIALKVAMFFGATAATGGWIALIVGLGVLLVTAYTKVKWFRDAVNAAFAFIKAHWQIMLTALIGPLALLVIVLVRYWRQIKDGAVAAFNFVLAHWKLIVSLLFGPMGAFVVFVVSHFNQIKSAASSVFNGVKSIIGSVAGAISSAWNTAFGTIRSAIQSALNVLNTFINAAKTVASLPSKVFGVIGGGASSAVNTAKDFLGSFIPHAEGGYIGSPQMALVGERGPEVVALPGGSTVIPNHQLGGGRIVVPVYLDRRQIALAMGDYTADRQAAR